MTLNDVFFKVAVAMDESELDEYKEKIYQCADSVQREIAAFVAPIIRHKEVESVDGKITLPEDCYEVLGITRENVKVTFTNNNDGTILVKKGIYDLKYNAYPKKIDNETPLTHGIEISKEAAEAMVYGICAGLCINDEAELYSAYMDRYNSLLEAILLRKNKFPFAEVTGGVML